MAGGILLGLGRGAVRLFTREGRHAALAGARRIFTREGLKAAVKGGGRAVGRTTLKGMKVGGKAALYGGSMWMIDKLFANTGIDAQSLFGFHGGGIGGSIKNKLIAGAGINGQLTSNFTIPESEQQDNTSNLSQKNPDIPEPDSEEGGGTGGNSEILRLLYKILRNTEKDLSLTKATLDTSVDDLNKTLLTHNMLKESSEKTEDSLEDIKSTEKEILEAEEPQKKLAKLQLDELTKQNSDRFDIRGDRNENEEGEGEGYGSSGSEGRGGSWLSNLAGYALTEGIYHAGKSALKFVAKRAVIPAAKAVVAAGAAPAAFAAAATAGFAAVLEGAAGSVKAARLKEALPKEKDNWDNNAWQKLLSMMDENETKIYDRAVKPYLTQLESIKEPEAEELMLGIRRRWYTCLYNLRLTGSTNGVILSGSDNPYVTAQLNSARLSNLSIEIQQCRQSIQARKKEAERQARVEESIQKYKNSGNTMARDSKEYQDAMELKAWRDASIKIKGLFIKDEATRRAFFEKYIASAGYKWNEDLYKRFTSPLKEGEHRLTETEEIAIAEAEHSKKMRTDSAYRKAEETRLENDNVYSELESMIDSRLETFEYNDQLSRDENAANFVQLADELEAKINESSLSAEQKDQLNGKITEFGNTFAKNRLNVSKSNWEDIKNDYEDWNEFDESEDYYHVMRDMAKDELERRKDTEIEEQRRSAVREHHEQAGEYFSVLKPEFKNSDDLDVYNNPDNYEWFKTEEDELKYRLETYPEDRDEIANSPQYSTDLKIKYGLTTAKEVEAERQEWDRLDELAGSQEVDSYGLEWLSEKYKGNRFRDNMGRYIMARYANGGELSDDNIVTIVSEALEFAKDQQKIDNGQTVFGANGRYDENAVWDTSDESFSDNDRATMERILKTVEKQGKQHNEEREAARRELNSRWEQPLDGSNIDD